MVGCFVRSPFAKILQFGGFADLGGLLDGWECSEDVSFATDVDVSYPSVFVARDARNATGVVFVRPGSVPAVFGSIGGTKVDASVIENVPIDVICPSAVIGTQSQNHAVKQSSRLILTRTAPDAVFGELPLMPFNERYVTPIYGGTRAVKTNFDVSNVIVQKDSGRGVTFPAFARGFRA